MLDPLLKDKEDLFNVLTIVGALLPSPGLLLFVARPDLFEKFDTLHLLLLLPGIGIAIFSVCAFVAFMIRDAMLDRADQVRRREGQPIVPRQPAKDWYMLSITAGAAISFLLVITVWAYWHPIRLGATLVLMSLSLLAWAIVVSILMRTWPIDWTNPTREQRRKAAELIAAALEANHKEPDSTK